ncbi:PQQ-like beta-propeller repeat protein [Stieleria mannarensis]|uniref:PQQ-like beta-propeller repeat protein n=1 Tax=Stieleria mannarensis TaxID=2755585 RepID=UPI0015FFB7D7|nr:PQQ-binding-like beta-propeller repeat protein [Rhodopirellula sp. JC639]
MSFDVDSGQNILWKVTLPKHGMSSPVVWNDRIFLTGADPDSRQIYCLDVTTGDINWTHDVNRLEGESADGTLPRVLEETGYAAPTPTTNGRYVAAVFATGELACVDWNGKRLWAKHLGVPKNHYGHASSLISDGDRLFVQFDHDAGAKLLAFDFSTGKLQWSVTRTLIAWSSPILIDNAGRNELVLANSNAVDGYDPQSGDILWHVECLGGEVAPSPAFSDGRVFVANDGEFATAIDIRDRDVGAKVDWQWDESLPDTSSPVADRGLLILPTAFGVVSCLDAATGTLRWEHEFDVGFSSSPIVAGDRVFLADLSGTVQIFKLNASFELLGKGNLGEPIYATPALVGNRIFIRSLRQLFCIQSTNN